MGTGNGSDSTCSLSCQWNTPVCNGLVVDPTSAYPGATISVNGSGSAWADGTLYLGSDSITTGNPVSYSTAFNNIGTYIFNYTLVNPSATGFNTTCSGQVVITNTPVDGMCNATTESTLWYIGSTPSPLCTSGTATGLSYDAVNAVWTWSCEGMNGGMSDSCMASGSYCGDGIIGTGA